MDTTTAATTTMLTVSHREMPNGKHRYFVDGEVHTKGSTRLYTHASVYREIVAAIGSEPVTITRPTNTATERAFVAEHGPTYESRRPVYAPVPEDEQQTIVFLHSRADLAAKGSPDANRLVERGRWARVPGAVEIVGHDAAVAA